MRALPSVNTQCGIRPPSPSYSSSARSVGQVPRPEAFAAAERISCLLDRPCSDLLCDVLPDGVPMVAVHAPFALFKVDGIRWEIPVDDRVTVPVEVKPSCPIEVVPSTNGQNGELNEARTSSRCRPACWSAALPRSLT